FLSMDWMLVWTSWHNYTENMVILTYSLTIWAIYKSIEEQKYIILAGVFAGIGYLTKSSMGFFFIIAGLCGFAWRFYFMRWKLFKNIYYITAVGIFALFVVSWAIRNLYHFWDGTLLGLLTQWQTSESIAEATAEAFHQPSVFLLGLFIKTVFFALLYSYMCILWVTPLKKNLVLLLCCINDKSVLAEPPSAGRRLIGKDELCNTTGIT
ncbi:MAG: glycosyltransferase family 39 protein, partial [Thermoplasmata archaeon]